MKNKMALLIASFALAAVFILGQAAIAAQSNSNEQQGMGNMMNGNGKSNMMQMMENEEMQKMMDAMNSPEGQEMMKSCSKFMESNEE